ncbi:hypothetical protein SAMN04487905_10579 [Actinopolyspora xinjiangensis]|uniref:Extracellular solute-binding protein, family 3 n=1 Tax=Actinopolyspora xinjiangensis TaxID=405564 RepID=A0A1H0TI50_9ACTN|nr:hypothetical protein [Actinopolyspora xinjiangensis]SDP53511.1 hypothetical protein SAMN04487905_10579 [Actinopolyspora xinjiangensis]
MWLRVVPRTVLGVISVLLFSACATTGDERGAAQLPPLERDTGSAPPVTSSVVPTGGVELPGSPTVSRIRSRGELLVGVPNDASDFVRRAEGEYRGFDTRIASILAAGLDLDPESGVAFRLLPSSLRTGALDRGGVDVLLGGFRTTAEGVTVVAPYVVTGPAERPVERRVGIAEGDEKFRDRLRAILADAVDDGRWEEAAEETLRDRRPRARAPEIPR